MNKRWIYILIIFLIGIAALYVIVDSSTTVGTAIISVHTYTTTLPDSYNIENTQADESTLINRQTDERIFIEYCGKGDVVNKSFDEKLIDLQNNENVTKINYNSETYNDIPLKVINYEKLPNNTINKVFIFVKYNHTFLIQSKGYMDMNTLNENAHFLIDTLNIDYKKTQD